MREISSFAGSLCFHETQKRSKIKVFDLRDKLSLTRWGCFDHPPRCLWRTWALKPLYQPIPWKNMKKKIENFVMKFFQYFGDFGEKLAGVVEDYTNKFPRKDIWRLQIDWLHNKLKKYLLQSSCRCHFYWMHCKILLNAPKI